MKISKQYSSFKDRQIDNQKLASTSFMLFFISFVGTVAEGAPVVPISAQLKYNIDAVCEYIVKKIPIPTRDFTASPRLIGMSVYKVLVMFCDN